MSDFNGRRRERPKTTRTFYGHSNQQMNELVAKLTDELEALRARVETLELVSNSQQQPLNANHTSHKPARGQQRAGDMSAPGSNNQDVNNSVGGDSNNMAVNIDDKRRAARIVKRKERGARKRLNQNPLTSHQQQLASIRPDPIDGSPIKEGLPQQQQQQNGSSQPKLLSEASQQQQAEDGSIRGDNNQNRPRDRERYPRNKPRKVFSKTSRAQPGQQQQQQQPKLPNSQYFVDDSTTQVNEPSSEDRQDGEDRDHPSNDRRVYRKKRPTYFRRGNKRGIRRVDSSERNSNDTSPHNEANGYDEGTNGKHQLTTDGNNKSNNRQNFPQLSEDKMNEVIQTLKRQFDSADRKAVRNTINSKGPKVAYEFAVQVLDHAICDETSPTMLKETASELFYLISSDGDTNHDVDFQNALCKALTNISEREDEIAIDAPRYLDTLGQLLADIIVPLMDNPKQKANVKRFIERGVNSYNDKNRATFLATIMRGLENSTNSGIAKNLWDQEQLSWSQYNIEGSLEDFLDQHGVRFTA